MSFFARRQRASQQDRASAQSKASPPSDSLRWARFFGKRDRHTTQSEAGETPSHCSPQAILQGSKAPDYTITEQSGYHNQTTPHPDSVSLRVWESIGPLPSLRHRGHFTPIFMTSNDKWEVQAQNDDPHVNTTPKRRAGSTELRRRTAQALNTTPTHALFGPLHDPYSEAVADWNLEHHSQEKEGALRASLDTPTRQRYSAEESRRRLLSHKLDVSNLRQDETGTEGMGFFKKSHDKERKLKSSHEEKPLPPVPNGQSPHRRIVSDSSQSRNIPERPARPEVGLIDDNTPDTAVAQEDHTPRPHDSGVHGDLGRERGYLMKDSSQPVDLTDIVDLSHTSDTDVAVTYAPQVTHETRHINTHEILQESITREIHNYHIYHRTLPVLDFEVLPAKHYVPLAGGGLTEIPESDIPGGAALGESVQKVIATALANAMPKAQQTPVGPRRFTARTFEGTEGDYKEWVGEDGIKRTEQWWVHPPTIAKSSAGSGAEPPLTYHFHWEDHSSVNGGREKADSRGQPLTKRWPPPRGASLGKTSLPLPGGGGGGGGEGGETTSLPIRTVNGARESSNEPPPVVGIAY